MRLSNIADIVAAQVPLCPLPTVLMACRRAVQDYLHRTRAWTAVVHGEWRVDSPWCELECPMDSEAVLLHSVYVDGREIPHFETEVVLRPHEGAAKNGPSFWRFVNGRLELHPFEPRSEEAKVFKVQAHAVLGIAARNPELPRWLDADDIAYGAMANLYEMAGQTWSNPSLAAYFEEKFDGVIADKRIERTHGGKPGTLTIKTPHVGGYF